MQGSRKSGQGAHNATEACREFAATTEGRHQVAVAYAFHKMPGLGCNKSTGALHTYPRIRTC
jgi:hypothetical protein